MSCYCRLFIRIFNKNRQVCKYLQEVVVNLRTEAVQPLYCSKCCLRGGERGEENLVKNITSFSCFLFDNVIVQAIVFIHYFISLNY